MARRTALCALLALALSSSCMLGVARAGLTSSTGPSTYLEGTLVVTDKDWISGEEGLSDYALRDGQGALHRLAFTGEQGRPSDRWGSGSRIGVSLSGEPPACPPPPTRPARALLSPRGRDRAAAAGVRSTQTQTQYLVSRQSRRQLSADSALQVDTFQILAEPPSSQPTPTISSTEWQQWVTSPSPPGDSNPPDSSQGQAQLSATDAPAVEEQERLDDEESTQGSSLPTVSSDQSGFANRYGDSASDAAVADQVSMAVFIVDMCGQGGGPAATRQEVQSMLLSGSNSLASYFSSCSYGIASVKPETTLVMGPISLGCNGTNKRTSWTVNSCNQHDYYGWMFALEDWAEEQAINLSPYRHRVIITPLGQTNFMAPGSDDCKWTGQAVIGPFSGSYATGGYSYVWINGDYWNSPQGWFHEIGHNYYLGHAAVPQATPYSDFSCAMGFCCKPRCMNPPHNWQLGWANEVDPDRGPINPGETRLYILPAQNLGPRHVLRLPVPWTSSDVFWLGYRTDSFPVDLVSLASGTTAFSNGINVYRYPGASTTDATNTEHVGFVTRGKSWADDQYSSSLVVRHLSSDGHSATVSVCRIGGEAERCGARLDFNCNGLFDGADPDCIGKSPPEVVNPPPAWQAGTGMAAPVFQFLMPPPPTNLGPPVPTGSPPTAVIAGELATECTSESNFDYLEWRFTTSSARAMCCAWCTTGVNEASVCRTVYIGGQQRSACGAPPPPAPSPAPSNATSTTNVSKPAAPSNRTMDVAPPPPTSSSPPSAAPPALATTTSGAAPGTTGDLSTSTSSDTDGNGQPTETATNSGGAPTTQPASAPPMLLAPPPDAQDQPDSSSLLRSSEALPPPS